MRQFITIFQDLPESDGKTAPVVDGLAVDQQQLNIILAALGHPMTKTGKILFGGWDQFVENWEHGGFMYTLSVSY